MVLVKKTKRGPPSVRLVMVGVRMPTAMKAALDKCAEDETRPTSVQAQKIIADYLREKGYLK